MWHSTHMKVKRTTYLWNSPSLTCAQGTKNRLSVLLHADPSQHPRSDAFNVSRLYTTTEHCDVQLEIRGVYGFVTLGITVYQTFILAC